MSRQDLPDDPPMKICNILMLPPTPSPSWMQYLSHAGSLPLLSPVLRPIFISTVTQLYFKTCL